jgi:hypothetical protein
MNVNVLDLYPSNRVNSLMSIDIGAVQPALVYPGLEDVLQTVQRARPPPQQTDGIQLARPPQNINSSSPPSSSSSTSSPEGIKSSSAPGTIQQSRPPGGSKSPLNFRKSNPPSQYLILFIEIIVF